MQLVVRLLVHFRNAEGQVVRELGDILVPNTETGTLQLISKDHIETPTLIKAENILSVQLQGTYYK